MAERQRDWSKIAENAVLLGVQAAGVVLPISQTINLVRAVRGTKGDDEAFARGLLEGIEGWCRDHHDDVGDLPPRWKDRLLDRLDGPVSPTGIGLDVLTASVFSATYTERGPDQVAELSGELASAMPVLILRADSRIGAALEALLSRNFTELGQRLDQIQADQASAAELVTTVGMLEDYLARLLRREVTDLLVHDPFPARDVDLTAFRMVSDVTSGDVPAYVARDVDTELDALLSESLSGQGRRLVAVAGHTKSGKSRCLLEALRRRAPLYLVYTLRRSKGRDTLNELVDELVASPPDQPWVALVEDLYEHLADGAALAAAVRKAGTIDPQGLIVATTTAATLSLTKADRLTAGINDNDIELIDAHHVELPRQATAGEQARAKGLLGAAFTTAGASPTDLAHFPERLAAIPELHMRLRQACSDPSASNKYALMLAATQRALALGTRTVSAAEARDLARCIHRRLAPHERRDRHLTAQSLDEAETWASQRVGAAYALLTPVAGTDDDVEILDAALDHLGPRAIGPQFQPCTTDPDATEIGAAAFVLYDNLPAALEWSRPAAEGGDTGAMSNLGILLAERSGEGDLAAAEEWWRQAAGAGHTGAMFNLGLLLKRRGGERNLADAETWYRQAAGAGHTGAMSNLGILLAERGGEDDLAAAEEWWRRAGEAGHTEAMSNLGLLLAGRGGEDDLAAAEEWWRRAAEAGDTAAMSKVGALLQQRGGEDDLATAEEWYRRAAEAGHTEAMSNLGILLAGRGGEGDLAAAEEWWRRAAEAGQTEAAFNLGLLLDKRGGEDDLTAAEEWYGRAAEAGQTSAMFNLGLLLVQRGGEDDLTAAEEWWTRAAEAGHTEAAFNLGVLLAQRGGEDDLTAAEEWWTRAAEAGHAGAMFNLGILYKQRGDEAEAEGWFRQALDSGHPEVTAQASAALEAMDRPASGGEAGRRRPR